MKKKIVIIVVVVISLVVLFGRDKINCIVTNFNLRNNSVVINQSDSAIYLAQFNNLNGEKLFKLSLIELGGYGCKPCMRMDTVLAELGEELGDTINIKKIGITNRESWKIAKYFGVSAIPTQIIINKEGEEVFRHTGFISKEALSNEINSVINNN
jgi:thioredoxin 1